MPGAGSLPNMLTVLRDEYGKSTVWFWGLEDSVKATPREKRFLKLSNTARSLSEIASQASIFIPMTMPSAALPSYVMLDPKSQWHVSALLSTAMESMTLPSRLKLRDGAIQTLDHIASALNINGNQNIAKLRMSIDQKCTSVVNGRHRVGRLEVRAQSRDSRLPSQVRSNDEPDIAEGDDVTTFDMDFFPAEAAEQGRGRWSVKKTHVFGQAENYRGDEDTEENEKMDLDEDEGFERARRRAAGLSVIHKTRTPMFFPLLDSFPHIFASTSPTSLSVNTSLSTDTTVALRFKNLQRVVARAVGIDEREALSNSLGEMAEAYEEGWDSGSDEDED